MVESKFPFVPDLAELESHWRTVTHAGFTDRSANPQPYVGFARPKPCPPAWLLSNTCSHGLHLEILRDSSIMSGGSPGSSAQHLRNLQKARRENAEINHRGVRRSGSKVRGRGCEAGSLGISVSLRMDPHSCPSCPAPTGNHLGWLGGACRPCGSIFISHLPPGDSRACAVLRPERPCGAEPSRG